MKKMLLLLIAFVLIGCKKTDENPLSMMVPSGIPLVAVGAFLNESEYEITDVNSSSLLVSAFASNSHDIVIAPLNLGTKIYNTTNHDYLLSAVISFGNSYVITRQHNPLETINDLQDVELMAYGQNSTPDIALRLACKQHFIHANITYQSGINLVVPFFLCNPNEPNDESCTQVKYILAAEPILSMLEMNHNMTLKILDLQDNLKELIEKLPQAAIFVNKNSERQEQINLFLERLKEQTEYLNNYPNEYAENIYKNHPYFLELSKEVIANSIPRSQIEFVEAKVGLEILDTYFTLMLNHYPDLIGGKAPSKEFYR
jgi:NitT/TauT family transport system substrate-binding protein